MAGYNTYRVEDACNKVIVQANHIKKKAYELKVESYECIYLVKQVKQTSAAK